MLRTTAGSRCDLSTDGDLTLTVKRGNGTFTLAELS